MATSLDETDRLIQSGSIPQAIALLGQMDQNDPKVLYQFGICYFRLKEFPEAEAHFRKTIAQKSDANRAWYYLGLSLERQDRRDDALLAYRVSNTIDPTFTKAVEKIHALGGTNSVAPVAPVVPIAPPPSQQPKQANKQAEDTVQPGDMEKGIYTERKSTFTFVMQRILSFLFAAALGGVFVGAVTGIATGEEVGEVSVIAGIIGGLLFGLVAAGNTSRRIS